MLPDGSCRAALVRGSGGYKIDQQVVKELRLGPAVMIMGPVEQHVSRGYRTVHEAHGRKLSGHETDSPSLGLYEEISLEAREARDFANCLIILDKL